MAEETTKSYATGQEHKIRREHDFVIKHIKIVAFNGAEYDVTNLRVVLNIYEDLFNICTSGDITLLDANDLPNNLPIIGEEKIKIKFTRLKPTNNPEHDEELEAIDVEYRIYHMSERQNHKDKTQIYTLHFTQAEFISNLKKKLSRSFMDIPYSDMADIAFGELGSSKPIVIEPTDFEHKYICPNLSPFEMIQTIACRSVSANGNGATYFFFSDRDTFFYVSGGYLIDQEPMESYTYQIKQVLEQESGQSFYKDMTIAQDLRVVENYGYSKSFNILESLAQGHYASNLLTYDIVRQIYTKIDFDYVADFGKFKHLAKEKPHTDELDALYEPKSFMRFLSTDLDHDVIPWIAGKEPGIKPNRVEEYTLYRYSQIKQMQQHAMRLQVSGDPRRKVGQVIEFIMPQHIGNLHPDQPEELDEYLQGKYLVTSIAHRLERDQYIMELEIIKDSYVSGIEHKDPNKRLEKIY